MKRAFRVLALIGCLLGTLCADAQAGRGPGKIVLPNPQLIHCHSAQCSQLWKEDSPDGGVVYPSQVLADLVNGSVNGLTAVYDKSVSIEEVRAAVNARYRKWAITSSDGLWRVEPGQLAIQLTKRHDGTTQLIYLQFGAHHPSAHIYTDNCSTPVSLDDPDS